MYTRLGQRCVVHTNSLKLHPTVAKANFPFAAKKEEDNSAAVDALKEQNELAEEEERLNQIKEDSPYENH